jgi:hypothetical protein
MNFKSKLLTTTAAASIHQLKEEKSKRARGKIIKEQLKFINNCEWRKQNM